jgi:hypothetical protein
MIRSKLCNFIRRMMKSRRKRWAGHVARMVAMSKALKNYSSKTWREETTSETRRRWEENIKLDLKEIERAGVDWIQMAHVVRWRALVKTVLNPRFHKRRKIS